MAYKGNSYIAVNGQAQSAAGMPKPIAKPIREDGSFTQDTWRYLNSLSSAPPPEAGITVGPSPATFQAAADGNLLVSGGTISAISITRNGTYNVSTDNDLLPLSIGDIITVTYSVLPVLTWFPR